MAGWPKRPSGVDRRWNYIAALAVIVFYGALGLGADEVANSVEEGDPAIAASSETIVTPNHKPVAVSFFGEYYGPSLAQPGKSGIINPDTAKYDDTSPQNLTGQFKLDFNFTDDFFAGPVFNFEMIPANGQFMNFLDSGARIGVKHIINSDGFSLMADFRVMAPVTASLRAADEVFCLQTLNIFTYEIPKSKFTLGVLAFHQYFQFGASTPTRDPKNPLDQVDMELYFAPNVSYQVAKSLAATLFFEVYPVHMLGASWDNWTAFPSDIAPGISWDITPNINVSPQILFYPSNLSWNTIGSVLYLNAKLL